MGGWLVRLCPPCVDDLPDPRISLSDSSTSATQVHKAKNSGGGRRKAKVRWIGLKPLALPADVPKKGGRGKKPNVSQKGKSSASAKAAKKPGKAAAKAKAGAKSAKPQAKKGASKKPGAKGNAGKAPGKSAMAKAKASSGGSSAKFSKGSAKAGAAKKGKPGGPAKGKAKAKAGASSQKKPKVKSGNSSKAGSAKSSASSQASAKGKKKRDDFGSSAAAKRSKKGMKTKKDDKAASQVKNWWAQHQAKKHANDSGKSSDDQRTSQQDSKKGRMQSTKSYKGSGGKPHGDVKQQKKVWWTEGPDGTLQQRTEDEEYDTKHGPLDHGKDSRKSSSQRAKGVTSYDEKNFDFFPPVKPDGSSARKGSSRGSKARPSRTSSASSAATKTDPLSIKSSSSEPGPDFVGGVCTRTFEWPSRNLKGKAVLTIEPADGGRTSSSSSGPASRKSSQSSEGGTRRTPRIKEYSSEINKLKDDRSGNGPSSAKSSTGGGGRPKQLKKEQPPRDRPSSEDLVGPDIETSKNDSGRKKRAPGGNQPVPPVPPDPSCVDTMLYYLTCGVADDGASKKSEKEKNNPEPRERRERHKRKREESFMDLFGCGTAAAEDAARKQRISEIKQNYRELQPKAVHGDGTSSSKKVGGQAPRSSQPSSSRPSESDQEAPKKGKSFTDDPLGYFTCGSAENERDSTPAPQAAPPSQDPSKESGGKGKEQKNPKASAPAPQRSFLDDAVDFLTCASGSEKSEKTSDQASPARKQSTKKGKPQSGRQSSEFNYVKYGKGLDNAGPGGQAQVRHCFQEFAPPMNMINERPYYAQPPTWETQKGCPRGLYYGQQATPVHSGGGGYSHTPGPYGTWAPVSYYEPMSFTRIQASNTGCLGHCPATEKAKPPPTPISRVCSPPIWNPDCPALLSNRPYESACDCNCKKIDATFTYPPRMNK